MDRTLQHDIGNQVSAFETNELSTNMYCLEAAKTVDNDSMISHSPAATKSNMSQGITADAIEKESRAEVARLAYMERSSKVTRIASIGTHRSHATASRTAL